MKSKTSTAAPSAGPLRNYKKLTACIAVASTALLAGSASADLSISNGKIMDGYGNPVILRGINHAHTWYEDKTPQALKDIAATGANSVRIVLSNGAHAENWGKDSAAQIASIIEQMKALHMIAILEVHDSTGYPEKAGAANMSTAIDYWIEMRDVLVGQEDYVIINLANEPFGNGVAASEWINSHIDGITRLRAAGLNHTLMVDAASWGQDWEQIMINNAPEVFAADPLANTVFSVHMYQVYNNRSTIDTYLRKFVFDYKLPLVVGEFGADHGGANVDEASIMELADEYDVGYLGWSWSGNSSDVASLDIALNYNAATLSSWGDFLINSAHGIRATSQIASIFTGGNPPSSSSSSSTSSMPSSSSSSSVASSSPSSSSSSVSGAQQCNWYGTLYSLCNTTQSGWGWEGNQSCVAVSTCSSQPAPYGVVGGSSSSGMSSSSVAPSSSSSSTVSSVPASSSSSSSSSTASGDGNCEYIVSNEWNTGFTGAIRITNEGSSAINGWNVSWSYSDGTSVTSAWNATVSGNNPYSASNLGWNGTIQPGQTVEFGFQGNKGSSNANIPTLTGSVCN